MKKIFLIALCMLIPLAGVYANKQDVANEVLVDDVSYTYVVDDVTGKTYMKPRIAVKYSEQTPSIEEDTDASVVDGATLHSAEKFEIYMRDITANTEEVLIDVVDSGQLLYEAGNNLKLNTGSLYEFKVLPFHNHQYKINEEGDTEDRKAPYVDFTEHPKAIAMTDLDVKVSGEGNSLTVTFENLGPGVNYDILYERGDVSDINSMNGKIENVKDSAEAYVDEETFRKRYKFVISNSSIKAGQIYSVHVQPTIINYNGINIKKNKTPHVVNGSTEVPLDIYEQGEEYLKLVWWGVDSTIGLGGAANEYTIKEVHLIKKDGESGSENIIAKINGEDAVDIGYYTDFRPVGKTFYKIKLIYTKVINGLNVNLEMESSFNEYNPSVVNIAPIKPEIPKINTKLTEDDNVVPDMSLYKGAFKLEEQFNLINFVWGAFRHPDYENDSPEMITNLDVYYDLWVTDSLKDVYGTFLPMIEKDSIYASNLADTDDGIKNVAGDVVGFRKRITEYVGIVKNQDGSESFQKKTIVPNKIYYIKLIAKRTIGAKEYYSEPTIISIFYDYNGNIYAPQVISQNIISEKAVTENSIEIKWKKEWFEITEIASADKKWYSKVYTDNTNVYFTEQPGAEEVILDSQFNLDRIKAIVGATFDATYISRKIELTDDLLYEAKVIPYANVLKTIDDERKIDPTYDISDYIKMENDKPQEFSPLVPEVDSDDGTGMTLTYKRDVLAENTSYLFLLRSYRELPDGSKLFSSYPVPLVSTTSKRNDETPVDPTVPNILVDKVEDTEAVIMWEYNTSFTYELFYSEDEDVNKAVKVNYEIPINEADPNYPKTGNMFRATIIDLFPETNYYFWIKSKQVNGNKESAFSNALTLRTAIIQPDPLLPPDAMGIATIDEAVTQNHITLEWVRGDDDLKWSAIKDRNISKIYAYEVAVSDNMRFLDSESVVISNETVGSTVGNFEIVELAVIRNINLEPNKKYYYKIRTILNVVDKTGDKNIEKKSEYSPIRIFSTAFGNEYDGFVDFDKIEDKDKTVQSYEDKVWKYTIYGKDKFINEIMNLKSNNYKIDMIEYDNKDVETRIINIPKIVIDALKNEKVNLNIVTDEEEYYIKCEDLKTKINDEKLKIKISEAEIEYPKGFVSSINDLRKIEIYNDSKKIDYSTNPIEIKVKNKYNRTDLTAYIYDYKNSIWKKANSYNINSKDETVEIKTNIIGTIGVFDRDNIYVSATGSSARNDIALLSTYYAIEGINFNFFDERRNMTKKQIVNFVYGILKNNDIINLANDFSKSERKTLQRAGFDIDDGYLTQEEALDVLVKAYEMKTGEEIYVKQNTFSKVKDIYLVDEKYMVSALKAYEIGLIDEYVDPKEDVTLGKGFNFITKLVTYIK